MRFLSLLSLAIIVATCFAGLYWDKYKDNWFQTLGMAGIGVWAGIRFDQIALEMGHVSGVQLLAHISMASYFLGTAWKAWILNDPSFPLTRGKPHGY